MVPGKRILVVAVGAAAALALVGCSSQSTKKVPVSAEASPANNPAVGPAGAPASPSAPAKPVKLTTTLKATTIPQMGQVVTDAEGWVYYRFDKDTANPSKSNCDGNCAKVWPPALTDGNPTLEGITSDKVGTVTRSDGSKQLTLGGWPIYRYAGDPKPGSWKGQGVGGTWFVVAPDGKKNLTCLPTVTPTAIAPPADDPTTGAGAGTGTGTEGY